MYQMASFGLLALALVAPAAAFVPTVTLLQPTRTAYVQATTLGSASAAAPAVADKLGASGIATTAAEAVAALAAQGFAFDAAPGLAEDDRYPHLEPSVQRWRSWRAPNVLPASGGTDGAYRVALKNLQAAAATALRKATDPRGSAQQRQYWAYHAGRLAFFAAQNVVVLTLTQPKDVPAPAPPAAPGAATTVLSVLDAGDPKPVAVALATLVSEAVATWEGDFESIEKGDFPLPWDATLGLGHRQATPAFILDKARRYVAETRGIRGRRARGADPSSRALWKFPGAAPGGVPGEAASDLVSKLYPAYYQNNFHFQSDGWMSANSAAVYETATESLFLGRQDAMQRGALVPLARWAAEPRPPPPPPSAARSPPPGRNLNVLEVACGTGRFATFVRDAHPRADVTLTDLSPFYLEAARENQDYWERTRGRGQDAVGAVNYVQAAAEDLPFPDQSYDVVLCVYLFHELPPAVRRAAAAEMARVLKPGGLLVLTDSVQRGDRLPALDARLDLFTDLNEPYYATFVRENLTALLEAEGLTPYLKHVVSVSKTLSFTKPAAANPK